MENDTEEFERRKKLADEGDALEQCWVGQQYIFGTSGANKDEATGFEWLAKSARSGCLTAWNSMGVCYAQGKGTEKNEQKALAYYEHAASHGCYKAQYNLALLLETGIEGVPCDLVRSRNLFKESASQGYAPAQYSYAHCLEMGSGGEQNEAEAFQWYQRAAEQDNAFAQNELAHFYAQGRAMPRDPRKAFECYEKAASAGLAAAEANLGICYESGQGVEQDATEAQRWYERAAAKGDSLARARLARLKEQARDPAGHVQALR